MKYTSVATSGIRLSVETFDRGIRQSDSEGMACDFGYRIEMENLRDEPVRLVRRHWTIFDSLAPRHRVSGEGVVGEKPILRPFERYSYTSGCRLVSGIGSMEGHYVFVCVEEDGRPTGAPFSADIPRFQLFSAVLWN
ncbi:ApaG domain [bacterium]|nr:ApaG domain [bacterium]